MKYCPLLIVLAVLPFCTTIAFGQTVDPSQQSGSGPGQQAIFGQSAAGNGSAARTIQSGQTSQVSAAPLNEYAPAQIRSNDGAGQDSAASSANPARPDSSGTGSNGSGPPQRPRPTSAKPGEFENFVSDIVGMPVRRFGAELLTPDANEFTAPSIISIPPDYRINPGDEIRLGLTGTVQTTNLRLIVDAEGRIFVPEVGAVQVAGAPYRDLQTIIGNAVSRQYRNFTATVSITRLRGITIYVTGFATRPGSYTVGSLSTVISAVLAAGGPTSGGSLRSIQVRRGGRLVSDFDLYDFLLKGDKSRDIALQGDDVIFVAPAGAQVAAIGSVNNEAIYEAKAGDTLNDVLLYAGGINTVADAGRLHVLDPMGENGWQQFTPQEALTIPARRGQVLRVLSGIGIAQPLERRQSLVTVSGEVQNPGRYFVKPGTTMNEVIAMAGGLTGQAFPFGAVFVRDTLRRQQTYNFSKAVDELKISLTAEPLVQASNQDKDFSSRLVSVDALVNQLRARRIEGRLVLQVAPNDRALPGSFLAENNDALLIPPQPLAVGVYGMINSSADFRYEPGARIGDYIKQAGGFNRLADKRHIFVIRANGTLLAGAGTREAAAIPGDLVFVPIASQRGAIWNRLRDVLGFGFQGALAAASISAVTR